MSTSVQETPDAIVAEPNAARANIFSESVVSRAALPLSFGQERLWFLDRLAPQSPLYNVPLALRCRGSLHFGALQYALDAIVARHESLRTTFHSNGGVPAQVVGEPRSLPICEVDLSHLPEQEREHEWRSQMSREAKRPFDLSKDLLLRASLWRITAHDHGLLLNLHHIASDEWSLKILLRELSEHYNAFCQGVRPAISDLPIQYPDFALWERERLDGDTLDRELSYWLQVLDGEIPTLDLPFDRPRPDTPQHRGATVSLSLSESLSCRLENLSREQEVTRFMLLLAAFEVLVHRYTRQEDILIGTPVAGRTHVDTEALIGFFVNTLVLRTRVSSAMPFVELLSHVRQVTLDAQSHQDLPFEKLVAKLQPHRKAKSVPLIQVMFAVENVEAEPCEMFGLNVKTVPIDTGTSKFDFTFVVQQTGSSLRATVEYDEALFDRSTMERLLKHYETLLQAIVDNPHQELGALPWLTPLEREQILVQWNKTETNYPGESTLAELFEEQVRRSPGSIAAVFGAERFTYADLNERANYWAQKLITLGIGPDVLVGLYLDRSVEMVIGMLAIVKAGGAYLPLDPAYPEDRLAYVLEDANATVILTQSQLKSALPPTSALLLELDVDVGTSENNPPRRSGPEDLAYAIYTSGSTGRPKGTLIPQRAVVRLVKNTDYVQLTPSDRIAQASNPSFDAATFEIWGALLNGARLVGFSREVTLSPKEFVRQIRAEEITTLFLTTALFNQIACDSPEAFASLTHLLFGGEKVDPKWVRRVLRDGRPKRLLHVYGPTESTTFASWHEVTEVAAEAGTIPIGKPIANTQIYLLSPSMQPVPIGVVGELYIGGDGLARGYLNQPELTAVKFLPDPFSAKPNARLYRTGDLARCRADGSIDFIGRADHQVKIRGFRVELGEIESVLKTHHEVRESIVISRADEACGTQRLIAYVVLRETASTAALKGIRSFLKQKLPEYMVPSALIPMSSLPLNGNGKVDRDRLPAPELHWESDRGRQTPRAGVERDLAKIWEEILQIRPIGATDNFFELGGHSLLAVRLFAEIEKKFDRRLPLATLFQSPTIEQLAALIHHDAAPASSSLLVGIQPHGSKPPIYWVHSLGGDGGGGFFYYRKLAALLGQDQPSFGIRSPEQPLTSIEEMASRYVAEIRAFQPAGPYCLGGFCFGGTVAFEIARQLDEQGQCVDLLVLVESAVPRFQSADRASLGPRSIRSFLSNLRYWCVDVSHQSARDLFLRLRRKQQQLRKKVARTFAFSRRQSPSLELGDVIDMSAYPKDYIRYAQAHWQALLAYKPRSYAGRVTLFRARKQPLSLCDPTLGWGALAEGGVSVNVIPGTHEKILEEPNVQILAAELKACLAEAHLRQSEVDFAESPPDSRLPRSTTTSVVT